MVPRKNRPNPGDPMLGVDADEMRAMLVHEAQVHSLPGRQLRDADDGVAITSSMGLPCTNGCGVPRSGASENAGLVLQLAYERRGRFGG